MEQTDLQLDPNEASDLSPVLEPEQLDALGWDRAFVTVLDEVAGEDSLVVLGHQSSAPLGDGWQAHRIPARAGKEGGRTKDAESVTRRDGWLYLVGSQFGSKTGPLQASRSWIARVREHDVAKALNGKKRKPPKLEVVRLRFGLHRAVNDALEASGLELTPPGPLSQNRYIDDTMLRGAAMAKGWSGRVRSLDHPINVEGAGFRADGRLVLGLRYPVTADGAPLLVELINLSDVFHGASPQCKAVWWLDDLGTPDVPVGLRAIHDAGPDRFEAIVGNLDAVGKGSTVVEDDPRAGVATSAHVAFELPMLATGGGLRTRVIHRFEGERNVEGLATHAGQVHYVIDADGAVGLRSLEVDDASG